MTAEEIMDTEDFKRCVAFHGHICPGVSLGFRAAQEGMKQIKETRAEDEELVAIVETDACFADAVQVITGCTFGKGNFIYKDHGKMVLTLLNRKTGEGFRVALRAGALASNDEHFALLQKMQRGEADPSELKRFREIHRQRSCEILEKPVDQLFSLDAVKLEMPAHARIERSEPCAQCGEPTMASKLEIRNGRKVCRGCLEKPGA